MVTLQYQTLFSVSDIQCVRLVLFCEKIYRQMEIAHLKPFESFEPGGQPDSHSKSWYYITVGLVM